MGAGVIVIGAKQAVKNLETIEVPVLDDNSISDINETYDTSWYNLPANEWFSDKDEVYKDDTIQLSVSFCLTFKDTSLWVSFINLSSSFLAVTNLPSLPAKGELLTENVI
jgi:hypothetical protein